jgi:uncharacterized protein (DUF1684 family)
VSQLDFFRFQKDEFFRWHEQSPLAPEQQAVFQGLAYFPEDPLLRIEADVQPVTEQDEVVMQTSTGDVRRYRRYGRFAFTVDGQQASLTIFADEHGFFLPFVDALAGKETYGAGRYLEPEPLGAGRFLVDFNLAYNPYCAYNDAWSCPITPYENRLTVPIRAGEKLFS